jgi:hypothetical protein
LNSGGVPATLSRNWGDDMGRALIYLAGAINICLAALPVFYFQFGGVNPHQTVGQFGLIWSGPVLLVTGVLLLFRLRPAREIHLVVTAFVSLLSLWTMLRPGDSIDVLNNVLISIVAAGMLVGSLLLVIGWRLEPVRPAVARSEASLRRPE